ncbi:hypothetical protein FNFX1_1790 [Francisella cf. novicida Fx1]|nr:hypothetical protein FNFX1_1790 [Francisella cf. novicida Fx1]
MAYSRLKYFSKVCKYYTIKKHSINFIYDYEI